MNKLLVLISSFLLVFTLTACAANPVVFELEQPAVESEVSMTEDTETEEVAEVEQEKDNLELVSNTPPVDGNTLIDSDDIEFDDYIDLENTMQLTREEFDDLLVELVENPSPEDGIIFLNASIVEEDTIELKLDLEKGSLDAMWIAPIWDLLIRQLYVNSEYENEPTIIIRDANGYVISERS